MKPMLAFKTKESKLHYPVYIQPKFNGIRAIYLPEKKTFQSRDEILYDPEVLPLLVKQVNGLGFATDGELYHHGMSLQQINSRVAVNRTQPHNDINTIQYYIFDVVSSQPMYNRARMLATLETWVKDTGKTHIVIAPTHLVHSQLEADYYYRQWKDQGYEGLMYRNYDAPYGMAENCGNKQNRWWYLQKRKDFLDMTVKCTGVQEGRDGFEGMCGALECVSDDGAIFTAGSGLTLEQRYKYWHQPDSVIGADVVINYEMLSDGGIPLKPTVEMVHEIF